MAYFEDLSRYTFDRTASGIARARNVGWLGANHDFPKAHPRAALLDAIWDYCSILVVPTRGIHGCELCVSPPISFVRHDTRLLLGSGEIRVFDSTGGSFAAPNLVYHYIRDHQYRPLEEFLDAVLNGPRPGGEEYQDLLPGLEAPWQENTPIREEPRLARFVRTENGVELEEEKRRS